MKRTLLTLLGSIFISGLFAQSSNFEPKKNQTKEFINEKQKQEWINNNPDKYKEMGGMLSEEQEKRVKEMDLVKESKNDIPVFPMYIDTGNPHIDKLNYEKSKADWYAKKMAIDEKNGVYYQTRKEKEIWIKEHPELYNRK